MRAILVGAVESTRAALHAIVAAPDWQLAALVTLPLANADRHSDFVDLSGEAATANAEVIAAADANAPEIVERIAAIAADAVFVIGWSQLCRPAFLGAAGPNVIGYHPAPLPRLRGRGVIPWTILLDEPISGGTLFWIDAGTDTGAILAQRFFHVVPRETAATLYARHLVALTDMLAEALGAIAGGAPPRIAQDERCATRAARRVPDDGRIDWSTSAEAIDRLIRAVGRPYPGAFSTLAGERITIWSAVPEAVSGRHAATPGQIIATGETGFSVLCGDGSVLRVLEWTRASGKRPLLDSRLS